MPWPARPTLRLLADELDEDWEERAHRAAAKTPDGKIALPRLHQLKHPVIRHAAEVFTGAPERTGDIKRESISGLTSPAWWKLKTTQYRGAVLFDKDGQAWLCATGLRRKGDPDDFYSDFMVQVRHRGPAYYEPTREDRKRLRFEQTEALLGDWESALHRLACQALRDAVEGPPASFTVPGLRPAAAATTTDGADTSSAADGADDDQQDGGGTGAAEGDKPLGRAEIEVVLVPDDDDPDQAVAEIVATVTGDRSRGTHLDRAEIVVLAAINPDEQAWDPSYLRDGSRLYACLLTAGDLKALKAAAGAREPGLTVAGSEAHYAHRGRLTESAVEGLAVRAMCGTWFVPRQDAEPLDRCGPCDALYRELERQAGN